MPEVDDGWVLVGGRQAEKKMERRQRRELAKWWEEEIGKMEAMKTVVRRWRGPRRVGDWVCDTCVAYCFARHKCCAMCGGCTGAGTGVLFGLAEREPCKQETSRRDEAQAVAQSGGGEEAAPRGEETQAAVQCVYV